jgi:hypothetical protein
MVADVLSHDKFVYQVPPLDSPVGGRVRESLKEE